MKLRILQLPKLKLSVKQRFVTIALVSVFMISISTGLILYFNSIAHSSKADPTPTTLALFTATLNNTGSEVQVYWVTTNEYHSDYFTIQRSVNGIDYIQLAEIPGAGNSLSQLTYTYTDQHPVASVSYYRLRYTDIGGRQHEGATQEVNNEYLQPISSINVFPVPASNIAFVEVAVSNNSSMQISVVDVTGKIVKSINADLSEGKNKIKLDISNLPNGIYFVNMQDETGKKISQKMIKTE